MDNQKPKRSQINFCIPPIVLQSIRMHAAKRNVKVTSWVMAAIAKALAEENKY